MNESTLTPEQIEAEGWEKIDLSLGFAYRNGVPSYRHGFVKNNFWCVLDTRKPHIEIVAKDVLLIGWMPEFPENFRITIPCPTIQEFKLICNLIEV